MTTPAQIASLLVDDTYATPAAILVAFDASPDLVTRHADVAHMPLLRRLGCVQAGRVTELGERVADVLKRVHGVQAWPYWQDQ